MTDETRHQQTHSSARRSLRWTQWSLRALFVLLTALGVSLALFANHARRRGRAIRAIRLLGGEVYGDFQYRNDTLQEDAQPPAPKWLRELVGDEYLFANITRVLMDKTRARDDDLMHIGVLSEVENLNLSNTPVTDKGLVHLQRLRDLTVLDLSGTKVTDEGMPSVAQLPQLEQLLLEGTAISDDGLRHLKSLKNLATLYLTGGIHMNLDDRHMRVTAEGVAQLKKALPNLDVVWQTAPQAASVPSEQLGTADQQ